MPDRWLRLLLIMAPLCLPGCSGESGPPPSVGATASEKISPPWFVELPGTSGVQFSHQFNDTRRYFMPETIGGGVALLDHDGDGDLDIYLVQSGVIEGKTPASAINRLFRNDGNLQFTDVTSESGVGDDGYSIGVTC